MSKFFVDKKDCSHHTIFAGVDIFTACGSSMMLSLVEFQPHAVVEEHSHPHEQMGWILEGQVTFFIGGEEKTLGPGEAYRIPGGVKHRVVTLDRPAKVLDIFHPVREDYR